ncbi:MAG: cysteine desulfurase family protein (TIGR01976 family) [Lysobacterales bacterium]|jgi:cysteine desulfurase family protein (TIGR01976 family)
MTKFDTDFVRSQFPAFSEPSLEGFVHFENAGGSYACRQVVDRLHDYYRTTKLQPYYDFGPSRDAGELMDSARDRMAAWLNVASDELHFGPSTSQNTYVVAQALRQHLEPGDELIVTNQDHEANIGSWRRLEASGVVIREWQVNPETAELNLFDLDNLLNEKTKVVAFTQCSNIIGSINPAKEICEKIHAAGALAFVDAVAFAPHGLMDIDDLSADIYKFSLYKVYGPHLGAMVMRRHVNEVLPNQGHFFNESLSGARFTPAGPDHAQIASVNGVIDYMETIHDHHFGDHLFADLQTEGAGGTTIEKARRVHELFQNRERELVKPLLNYLSNHPKVRIVGKSTVENRAPTVSFTVEGQSSIDIASKLGAQNIGVGVGHCYAYRLIEALGIDLDDGVVRTSLVHYTSEAEVSRLIETLDGVF